MEDHVKKVKELARSSQEKIDTDYLNSSQKIAEQQKEKVKALRKEEILNDTPPKKPPVKTVKPQVKKQSNSGDTGGSFFDELE